MAGRRDVPGWTEPIYRGMNESAQFLGVPFVFGALLVLVALFCLLVMWQLVIVCAVVYGIVALACQVEPQFLTILKRHLRYHRFYEG